jgi:hypothetical protein
MPTSDLLITTNSFLELGGAIFGKRVLAWDIRSKGIQVRTNVKAPQAMTKLSAKGSPRPYSAADNQAGNGAKFTDRVLTVRQSKWDYDFDPEDFRNTYLANADGAPFVEAAQNQVAKEYLDKLTTGALYSGVYNAAGSATVDICDGFGTKIAAEVLATNLVPVVTGAITTANAVDKVELVAQSVPAWMREQGFIVYCSFNVFDKYKAQYRSAYGYHFKPDEKGEYRLDGINAVLRPMAMMNASQRLIATVENNLVIGTDNDAVEVHASMRRNIIEVRQLMPIGTEIQDLDAIIVNDQA